MTDLAAIHDQIALRRLQHQREDTLTAAYWVIEALDPATCSSALYTLVCAAALARDDADLAQLLAAKLGQTITWRHLPLSGDTWKEGRGHA